MKDCILFGAVDKIVLSSTIDIFQESFILSISFCLALYKAARSFVGGSAIIMSKQWGRDKMAGILQTKFSIVIS